MSSLTVEYGWSIFKIQYKPYWRTPAAQYAVLRPLICLCIPSDWFPAVCIALVSPWGFGPSPPSSSALYSSPTKRWLKRVHDTRRTCECKEWCFHRKWTTLRGTQKCGNLLLVLQSMLSSLQVVFQAGFLCSLGSLCRVQHLCLCLQLKKTEQNRNI